VLSYIGLLCQGKVDFEAIREIIIAYNLLRMIGHDSLKHKPYQKERVKRRRIRTVIGNMILLASHVKTHAREKLMAIG
jgi:hypothetical protein